MDQFSKKETIPVKNHYVVNNTVNCSRKGYDLIVDILLYLD